MHRRRIVSFALIAIGWLISGYLLLPHISEGTGVPGCSGCEVLAASESSWQLGYPIAGWGLVCFAVVGLLFAMGGKTFGRLAPVASGVGAGVSLVLLAHLLSGSVVWCGFCVATHVVNLLLLLFLWLPVKPGSSPELATGRFAGKAGLAVLAVAVVAGAGMEASIFRAEVAPEDAMASFEAEPVQKLALPDGDSPADGATAVEISVFSCFQCPGCQAFAATSQVLRERFGDRLHFNYYNFPLSTTCNPALTTDLHPRSCQASWAAEAARQQGKFWEYHDALFLHTNLDASEATLEAIARDLGLDLDQWNADRNSPLVQQKVSQDIQRGLEIRIDVTPSVFVNGRRVREPSVPALDSLIENELEGNG